jgi:hypothetical protein
MFVDYSILKAYAVEDFRSICVIYHLLYCRHHQTFTTATNVLPVNLTSASTQVNQLTQPFSDHTDSSNSTNELTDLAI